MAKGSGTTRTSTSSAPKGIAGGGYNISDKEYDKRWDEFRGTSAGPIANYKARQYKTDTGQDLPNDTMQLTFGRGALDGKTVDNILTKKEYSNIKKIDWYDKEDRIDRTFVTGYRSAEQLKSFLKESKTAANVKAYNRTQKLWNKKGGSLTGGL